MFSSASTRLAVLPLTALAGAASSAVVIAAVGATGFGFVTLLGTLFLLLPFADLGLGAAVVNAVAGRDGSAQREADARAVVRASLLILSGMTVLLCAAAASLTATELLPGWLGLPEILTRSDERWAVFFAILPFALSLPFGVGQRILVGLGRAHIVNLLAALTPVVAFATTLLLVSIDAPALYLGVATPVGILSSAIAMFFVSIRGAGWRFTGLLRSSESARIGVWSTALWAAAIPMLVTTVASPIGQQSGRVVLANLGTPNDLAEYSLAFQFYLPAVSVASAAGVALWSVFTQQPSGRRKILLKATGWMLALGLVLALCFFTLIDPVARVISDNQIRISLPTAAALSILILLTSAVQAPGMLLTRPRMLAVQAVCAVCMCVITIVLSVLLAPHLGASSPAIASGIGVLLGQVLPTIAVALWVTRGNR